MSGTLSLAASIASMDRAGLERLVTGRRVLSPASVQEPLGLAIELLRPESIARALQGAHRDHLLALSALATGTADDQHDPSPLLDAGAHLIDLAARGLVGLDIGTGRLVSLPEIEAQLPALDGAERARTGSSPDESSSAPADTSSWFGPALTSVRRAAELLRSIAERPVRLGRKGRPAMIGVRELAETLHCDTDHTDRLLDVLRAGGLLISYHDVSGTDRLFASATAGEWLALDYPDRWLALAQATLSGFDPRLRRSLTDSGGDLRLLVEQVPHDYPLLPETEREAFSRLAETAEDLGLTVGGRLSSAAIALFDREPAEARRIAAQQIPDIAPGVYLQPDLSLIVPGPLAPADEALLSTITEAEHLGPAASLRLSTSTLARAVRRGLTPDEIREFLQRLSLTGIPQPLEYLLRDLERKLGEGLDRAEGHWNHDRMRMFDDRTDLGRTDGIDRTGAAAQDRTAAASPPPRTIRQADEIARMIDRVLSASAEVGDEGDLTRRLTLAIRDRSAVQVTAVSGTDERVFTLLPVSLQGGRLRATDQQAGVERTLPVSAITAVVAA